MYLDHSTRSANALTLRWHAGATTIAFESFHAWGLAQLRQRLPFDGAIWGLIADPDAAEGVRISSAHVLGLAEGVMARFADIRAYELTDARPLGQVVATRLADAQWQGSDHMVLREHGMRFGLAHTLFMRMADPDAAGQQFILLSRREREPGFDNAAARDFEMLAPHLMQAYATRRRLFLDPPLPASGGASSTHAVALVDRAGLIHYHNPRFLPLLRREWSDWPGKRLPDPLPEVAARRGGSSWRFLGEQVHADFVPVDDIYLMTARPRHRADVLTAREGEVAQRYAAGSSFREIAESLDLAPATVRSHLRNVFGKLDIRNKTQLAAFLR